MTGSKTLVIAPPDTASPDAVRPTDTSAKSDERMRQRRAMLPVTPLLLFMLTFLVVPMFFILKTSVTDAEIARSLTSTQSFLSDVNSFPPPPWTFKALGKDLQAAQKAGQLRALGRRVGYEFPRGLNVIIDTSRAVRSLNDSSEPEQWKEAIVSANEAWNNAGIWSVIAESDGKYSAFYLRWALGFDVVRDVDGDSTVQQGYDFRLIYLRTITVSLLVTALTIIIGYPLAYVISTAQGRMAALLLFLILLPFWTSLLVRTMSWIVVLQTNGVLNSFITMTGIASEPMKLLYTRAATVLAMVQIQLPFTVLPMISVMKAIPPSHVRAARSLGAGPIRAHVSVFMPQVVPGIAAGGLLTFVLCLGFYLTPALVGGASDQMVSFFIAKFTNEELNWGLASALSVILVIGTSIVAFPLARFVASHSSDRI